MITHLMGYCFPCLNQINLVNLLTHYVKPVTELYEHFHISEAAGGGAKITYFFVHGLELPLGY